MITEPTLSENNTKFAFSGERIKVGDKTLYRIVALRDIATVNGTVKKGDKGGFIEREDNLGFDSTDSAAWIGGNARVFGKAWVSGNAWVGDDARVGSNAWIGGNARVFGKARVGSNAVVSHGKLSLDYEFRNTEQVKAYLEEIGKLKQRLNTLALPWALRRGSFQDVRR